MNNMVNNKEVFELLAKTKNPGKDAVMSIIEKSRACKGISLEDVSQLLNVEDEELLDELFDAAKFIKNKIYGKRVVLFAPLYTSNECTNNCLYCGFRIDNKELHRRTLKNSEIVEEAQRIEEQGHKRLLLICGEDQRYTNIDHIVSAMDEIYKSCDIRRINVETAPMSVEDYKKLKAAGVGTYIIFQETYDREVYKKMHPTGTKANFDNRLNALERAFEAGIDDFGIGALLGLNDYKFEVLSLLQHANAFEEKFGVGPHTISVPRLRTAHGWALDGVPHPVNDDDFKKIVAIYRLTVPYTGIILSTRESEDLRDELLNIGISQMSAGSKTNPGGYSENDGSAEQFEIEDHRSLDKVIGSICEKGYIPSFCTACYRRCRTGQEFMGYAKSAEINEFCQPNAVLTFKESLVGSKDEDFVKMGNKMIDKALGEIKDEDIRQKTKDKLKEIENGRKDIYF